MVEFLFFNFEIETLLNGLQVALYGLIGVFTVLILFFLVTRGLFVLANILPKSNKD